MFQKEIYWVDLNPVKGSEQSGKRPVVIVSGDTMNKNLGVSIVCPLSTKVKDYAACVKLKKTELNNLKFDSEIITFQIRTVSHERFLNKIGEISDKELKEVFVGLADVLQY